MDNSRLRPIFIFIFLLLATAVPCLAPEPPKDESGAAHVRQTDALTPEEQLATFRLPSGFEIELFAAEPAIGKPINMAFDSAGRLWVTQSSEYPYAADPGEGGDRITVLEDTDGDGRADSFTDFADDLNIPIGIHPFSDGAIGFSIPHVYRFLDPDGDLRANDRRKLIGPFGQVDTHGLVNNFVRGFDGWVYACHGFQNESIVSARDGRQVRMRSGNTFRFAPDGSQMEVTTTGRVNPFGQAYDDRGYLYSSDCHSTPIYQLIRGADYPTFHRGSSGIGYGPKMMEHTHGPTAISGLAFYTAEQFPKEFRQNFFAGNVVSNRVKRDSIDWRGSTPVAKPEPDFLVSSDPWFRPCDVKVGPDGALYVADFYNRIIAHYEVPLDHDGRDRRRGRIWRITYRGTDAQVPALIDIDWSSASLEELLAGLAHPSLPTRFLIADEISDRIGAAAVQPLLDLGSDYTSASSQRVMALWLLHRLDALPVALLKNAANSKDESLRIHSMRILAELPEWEGRHRQMAITGMTDGSPHVTRAAAEALAHNPEPEQIRLLLDARQATPAEDTHLRYTLLQSLRDHLRDEAVLAHVVDRDWNKQDSAALAEAMIGVNQPRAADFLIAYLHDSSGEPERTEAYLRHAALHVSEDQLPTFAALGKQMAKDDVQFEMTLFESMHAAARQRGLTLPEETRAWGESIVSAAIDPNKNGPAWQFVPHPNIPFCGDPWIVHPTPSSDGKTVPFLSSRQIDETFTGSVRSPKFTLPERLTFFIAGHAGFPDEDAHHKNRALLRSADDDKILRTAYPPRNDVAQAVEWDLSEREGEPAYIELMDGDDQHAYAWLAAGRFDPPVITVPSTGTGERSESKLKAVGIIESLQLETLVPELRQMVSDDREHRAVRIAATEALGKIDAETAVRSLTKVLTDDTQPADLRRSASLVLARSNAPSAHQALREPFSNAKHALQVALATELTGTAAGREWLLDAVESEIVPRRLLLERAIEERLLAALDSSSKERYRRLAAQVAPLDARLQQVIDERSNSFESDLVQPKRGEELFATNCAACHEVGGRGGRVGPQLDGIGNWGASRLIEKIIDPNRNVSQSFQYSTLTLKNGRSFTGLIQREEGETLVFADAAGREESISKSEIIEQTRSSYSLMPAIFADTFSEEELHDLVGYLLTLE